MISVSATELLLYVKNYTRSISALQKGCLYGMSILIFAIAMYYLWHQKEKVVWRKIMAVGVLAILISVIFTITLTGRNVKEAVNWMWQPLWSYEAVLKEKNNALLVQILWNIIIFIPLGILLPICFSKMRRYRYAFMTVFIVSATIEVLQGVLKIGLFELDDIMNNLLGTAIGVGMYVIFRKVGKRRLLCKN